MNRIAVYPGTFDPVTLGHMNIIKRAMPLFEKLIVAVALDTAKTTLFSGEERLSMVMEELRPIKAHNVIPYIFEGLLVNFALQHKATFIIRGLRAVSDFEFEFQFAHINRQLSKKIDTIFLPGTENSHFISSTFVKEIARLGGDVRNLVSKNIAKRLIDIYDQPLG